MKTKKRRKPMRTHHTQRLLRIVEMYRKETGMSDVEPKTLAEWAITNHLADAPRLDPKQILARRFARALRTDFIHDENGEPVRHNLVYRTATAERQNVLCFFKMEDAEPEKFQRSAQMRRRSILDDCCQLERDVSHYNKHFNTGESVGVDYNFVEDVKERLQPKEYVDNPPAEKV
jgi:hypothetical protein